MLYYLIPFGVATILSLAATPLIKTLANKWGIVDQPAPRKIHQKPMPLLGGLAIFLAFTITVIIFWFNGYIVDAKITDWHILAIIFAGIVLMVGGFLDDKYNLKPAQQFIFPILAIIIIIISGIKIQYITSPVGGIFKFSIYWGVLLAIIWLLGMIYTTKFLDGLDGLVTGTTLIGSIIIFIVSLYWDIPHSGTSILVIILAGALLGFLPYNWHPAKIFLGEGGSVFCGFMLGVLSIISGSKVATALLIMGVPILDLVWVVLRRIWQGKSPTMADRKHLHFRLLDIGLSHRQAVIFLYSLTASFGISSLFLHTKGKIFAILILFAFMFIMAGLLLLAYKLRNKSIQNV